MSLTILVRSFVPMRTAWIHPDHRNIQTCDPEWIVSVRPTALSPRPSRYG
jgi:hypothetical protein